MKNTYYANKDLINASKFLEFRGGRNIKAKRKGGTLIMRFGQCEARKNAGNWQYVQILKRALIA